jgi:hypothetical protein
MITVDSTGVKIQNFPLRRDWCFRVFESFKLLGLIFKTKFAKEWVGVLEFWSFGVREFYCSGVL